jgi:hypothetical protein
VGSSDVPTHFANVTIDLQGLVQFPVYAGFTSGLDQTGVGLLGQTGFFERFKITSTTARKCTPSKSLNREKALNT